MSNKEMDKVKCESFKSRNDVEKLGIKKYRDDPSSRKPDLYHFSCKPGAIFEPRARVTLPLGLPYLLAFASPNI